MAKSKTRKKRLRAETTQQKDKPMLPLNAQQQSALESMAEFLDSSEHFFLLSGSAGTGKTTTIQALIQKLQAAKKRVRLAATAPTHKAVKVLKTIGIGERWDTHNIDYATIYNLLGLQLEYDDEGGRTLVEGRKSQLSQYDLVILDEASMVSPKLWSLLKSVVPKRHVKIICLGDRAQLPPVNEPESPVFTAIAKGAQLTQVMRHSHNNPIADMIEAVRECVFNSERQLTYQTKFTQDQQRGFWVLERQEWLKQMVRAFQSPKSQSDPDFVRAIAWTNRTVNYLNCYIRSAIYEDAAQPYVSGERLVARETVFDPDDGEEILMSASSECEVIEAQPSTERYNLWKLKVTDDEGNSHYLKLLDSSSINRYQADLKKAADLALEKRAKGAKNPWEDYWDLRNRYAQLNYAYALTSHKSQGSTFSNVFVAQNDICSNPNQVERLKSLYVSYSRCSQRLLVNL